MSLLVIQAVIFVHDDMMFLYAFTISFAFASSQVEHVVREEKTRAAFDLLEIYCELIVARLPMIEAQKYVTFLSLVISKFSNLHI